MTTLSVSAQTQRHADFDELLAQMLGIVHHLQCADMSLYELQNVPEELQPPCIVVHRATEELDQLHNALDSWSATHVFRPKTDTDREAVAAECSRGMTPEERERYRTGLGLPAQAPESTPESVNPVLGAVERQRSRLINVLGVVQAVRIADSHSGGAPEADGALKLVEDEIQRILNGLDPLQLEKAAVGAKPGPKVSA
ncbi:MAG TPA: hypothetical protein VFY39_06560 [Gammaproteobacteria bacterium]|nr:hypothetical protein [Gammaproteobacteria bacterium]